VRHVVLICLLVLGALGVPAAGLAAPADDRAADVDRLGKQRARLDAERRDLERQLTVKTAEITELKKQRTSWNRDRKLAERLREAKDLSSRLEAKAAELRALDGRVGVARKALRGEVERELAAGAPGQRRAQLLLWRRATDGGEARRIEIVEPEMDPLDDPEDLDEKAGTLAESEARLRLEAGRLDRRAQRYRRQAKLAAAHRRAGQDVFVEEPHRGQSGGNPGAGATGDPEPADGLNAPPRDDGAPTGPADEVDRGGDDLVNTYADVVDPTTLDELDRAQRSGDPEKKAVAAERALRDLKARAERLKARRAAMERRAADLRAGKE
jgi:cell division protein FtsB